MLRVWEEEDVRRVWEEEDRKWVFIREKRAVGREERGVGLKNRDFDSYVLLKSRFKFIFLKSDTHSGGNFDFFKIQKFGFY